jgi:hypothetical protein
LCRECRAVSQPTSRLHTHVDSSHGLSPLQIHSYVSLSFAGFVHRNSSAEIVVKLEASGGMLSFVDRDIVCLSVTSQSRTHTLAHRHTHTVHTHTYRPARSSERAAAPRRPVCRSYVSSNVLRMPTSCEGRSRRVRSASACGSVKRQKKSSTAASQNSTVLVSSIEGQRLESLSTSKVREYPGRRGEHAQAVVVVGP